MVHLSTLCCTCNEALDSLLAEKSWRPLHRTLDSFRKAISQDCFICSTLWKAFSEQHRAAWTDSSTFGEPMQYRLYREESEKTLVKLEILYLEPISSRFTDIRFRLIPPEDDEFGNRFLFSDLDAETSSSSTLGLAYKWYLSCRTCHKRCTNLANGRAWYPTRLLDIGLEGDAEWKLHIPSDNNSSPPSYMTLSYRWSSSPGLMLLSSNIVEFRHGKLIRNLPRTFRDSIIVARKFSIRYIWIDALCIVQDSQEDWERESANMRNVYANSSCNIAASASTDPEGGLFRPRNPARIRPGIVRAAFSTSKPQNYYIFDKTYWDRQISDGPLHRRGWVFQERLLAPRVLHFAKEQIFWECFTEHKCEGFPHGIPFHSPLKEDFDPLWKILESNGMQQKFVSLHAFNLWNDLVMNYTKCALTRPSDKLIAFSGLARLFHDITGDEYVAGLWKSRLVEHLDWRVHEPAAKLSSEYRAPSWSWAFVDGPVKPAGVGARTTVHISILDVQVHSSIPNSLGRVLGGHIKLSGYVAQAICCDTGNTGRCLLKIGIHRVGAQLFPDALGMEFEEGKKICCLALNTYPMYSAAPEDKRMSQVGLGLVCLILESLQHASDTYRRVGHFILHDRADIEKFGFCENDDGSAVLSEGNQRAVITII